MNLAQQLLSFARDAAAAFAGTPAGDDAATDLRNLEALVAKHESELVAEAMDWLKGKLYQQPAG